MHAEQFARFLNAVKSGDHEEVFQGVAEVYNPTLALAALTSYVQDDKDIYAAVRRSLVNRKETEALLSTIWTTERIRKAKPAGTEFYFQIYLNGDSDIYIGATVIIDEGHPDVWFHHERTNERMLAAESCVDWSLLSPAEEAM